MVRPTNDSSPRRRGSGIMAGTLVNDPHPSSSPHTVLPPLSQASAHTLSCCRACSPPPLPFLCMLTAALEFPAYYLAARPLCTESQQRCWTSRSRTVTELADAVRSTPAAEHPLASPDRTTMRSHWLEAGTSVKGDAECLVAASLPLRGSQDGRGVLLPYVAVFLATRRSPSARARLFVPRKVPARPHNSRRCCPTSPQKCPRPPDEYRDVERQRSSPGFSPWIRDSPSRTHRQEPGCPHINMPDRLRGGTPPPCSVRLRVIWHARRGTPASQLTAKVKDCRRQAHQVRRRRSSTATGDGILLPRLYFRRRVCEPSGSRDSAG
ncbi:hypothetical protein K466DRAFT_395381 [Polyporus arcularius HHB13444]|uniref:Uncharacterized protein n=1 Tax=Polyporus arcularius HHB13444 TaxID=1314778 RepID=A0A5C3NR96_9APHY|nr:hypothetical protein K466DRAFT_395381 [Polyporus arcularius HHB13444]